MERTEVVVLWLHVGAIWFLRLTGNAIAGKKSTECGGGTVKPHERPPCVSELVWQPVLGR